MKIKTPHLAGVKLALKHMVILLKRDSTNKASGENQKAPAISLIKDQNAFYNGSQAALNGSNQPLKSELVSRNYSNKAADNYIKGFESKVACHNIQAARQASRAGYQAARMGLSPLTLEQQLRKGFTKEQSIAYVKAYDKCAGCPETQMNRKVKLAGYQAAKYGSKRPSNLKLSLRGFTPNHIAIYFQSYDSALDTPEGQLMRKAFRMASQMAQKSIEPPTLEWLLKRGLCKATIEYFYEIYSKKRSSKNP